MIQQVFAQSVTSIEAVTSTCVLNGREIPCDELGQAIGGSIKAGLGIIAFIVIIGIIASIFWVVMLVHAIRKPIESKALWIIVLLLFGVIGAIVYFFAVKRPFQKKEKINPQPESAKKETDTYQIEDDMNT